MHRHTGVDYGVGQTGERMNFRYPPIAIRALRSRAGHLQRNGWPQSVPLTSLVPLPRRDAEVAVILLSPQEHDAYG